MIRSISFCVIPSPDARNHINACLQSIAAQGVEDYEILVPGSGEPRNRTRFVALPPGMSPKNINPVRNHLCSQASKDYILLMDASLTLAPDWYANVRHVTWLDVIGSRLETRKGRRGIDWSFSHTLRSQKWILPLEYGEWLTRAFVNGDLMLLRKTVWDRIHFEDDLSALDGSEQFCLRAGEMGYRVGVIPAARGIFQNKGSFFRPYNPGKAYEEARKVVGRFRKNLFDGSQLFLAGNYDSALNRFRTVLEEDPDNIDVLSKVGLAMRNTGKPGEAIETFDRVLEQEPENKVALRGRGWAYLQRGQPDRAIPDLEFVMRNVPPGDYGPWLEAARGLAMAHFQCGAAAESIQVYEEILEKLPRDFIQPPLDVYQGLGDACIQAGNLEEADKHLSQALSMAEADQPELVPVLQNKIEQARQPGNALLQSGQFEQALKWFQTLIEREPENADALAKAGWALHNLGRYEEAIEYFGRALQRQAQHALALRGRGWAHLQNGQPEKALPDLKQAMKGIDAGDPAARLEAARGLGWAHYHCGHAKEAIQVFENALKMFPETLGEAPFDVFQGLGHACFKAGRMKEAERYLTQALEKADPNNADLIANLKATIEQTRGG